MKTLALVLALTLTPAWAQRIEINLDRLAEKAKEKQEINIDGDMIQKFAGQMKLPVDSVKRLLVRHYEFEKPGAFTDADLAEVRKQASGSVWSKIVNVKEPNESVEIYALTQSGQMAGFLLIVAEARELTVVHLEGSIQLAQLQELVQSSIKFDTKSLEQ